MKKLRTKALMVKSQLVIRIQEMLTPKNMKSQLALGSRQEKRVEVSNSTRLGESRDKRAVEIGEEKYMH